jgi:hypothetical protein
VVSIFKVILHMPEVESPNRHLQVLPAEDAIGSEHGIWFGGASRPDGYFLTLDASI